ncbi:MAG: sulfite exporter TauE/SafE family protein [Methylophilaceae bacterium]|nr:sulfite exporter TauE/SafE family protein [Methylophilaceae bacterium]
MELTLALLGMVVGLIMAITGAGGGIIGVPLLVLIAGLTVQQSAPIALMAVFFGAGLAAAIGWRKGLVRYRAALLIAISGAILSPAGLWLGHQIDDKWLNLGFAALLIVIALRALVKRTQVLEIEEDQFIPCIRDDGTGKFQWTSRCVRYLSASGGAAGLLSGMFGVGGGFVVVPALQKYTDLHIASVVVTSLAVTMLISLSVVTASAIAGKLDVVAAWPFVVGAVLGISIGYVVAGKLNRQQIQTIFSYLLIVVAILMASKSLVN